MGKTERRHYRAARDLERWMKARDVTERDILAFVSDYIVTGNQREKVKQLGQAVTPPVPSFIWQRIVESLR